MPSCTLIQSVRGLISRKSCKIHTRTLLLQAANRKRYTTYRIAAVDEFRWLLTSFTCWKSSSRFLRKPTLFSSWQDVNWRRLYSAIARSLCDSCEAESCRCACQSISSAYQFRTEAALLTFAAFLASASLPLKTCAVVFSHILCKKRTCVDFGMTELNVDPICWRRL